MIDIQNLSLQLGTKVLLDQASLAIYPGQKWGVIGSNGSGKSTLFKLLLGEVQSDSGSCRYPREWRLAYMAQEVEESHQCAIDHVLDGDAELRQIEAGIARSQDDGEQLAKWFSKMESIDGYSAPVRAQKLLSGLGFAPGDENRPVRDFSGGWRIRLNLAQALMCRSDLLLLDEPTNHLDLDASLWLEQWLQDYSGTLLIISHDRDFLDNVVTHIVSFEDCNLIAYSGNYTAFERQRAERLTQQASAFEKQQERIKDIENFVRRFRAKATKAKQAQSRLKELERMEKLAPAHMDSPFNFRIPEPDKMPQQLLNLSKAAVGYGQTPIVDKIELSILGGTRLGLLGHNGAGKSTLIKTLADEIPLVKGERVEGTHLKIGYFAQHQLEALDLSASCALHLQRETPTAREQEIRNFLGGFGFHGEQALVPIEHFSGGEKARLALALLAWQKPNLLLLDEPTNHLDLEVRHALTQALQLFSGAVVMVSHDRHLLRNTVDEFLLVDAGKVTAFDGDLSDYQQWLLQERRDGTEADSPGSVPMGQKVDKKEQRQAAAALREQLKPYTQAIKALEKAMQKFQAQLAEIDKALADPGLYEGGSEKLPELLKNQGKIKSQLSEAEEAWLEKSEELEQLQAELEP